jgi:hypothetical protein
VQDIRRGLGAAALSGLVLVPVAARGQKLPTDEPKSKTELSAAEREPELRLASNHTVVGRLNPLGLIYFSRLSFRVQLYESDSPVAKDNFFGIGVAPSASPAFARGGILLELQPLSVLQIWATYEAIGYFGTFEFFQSFPGVTANWSDSELDRLSEQADGAPTKSYATTGTQFNAGTRLQAKVGPVAARNLTRLSRPNFDLREGDRTFYDPIFDVLVPDEGWFLVNDLDVLWVTELGLTVGARWTMTHPFYEDEHYAAGEDPARNPNTTHRLGPLLAYTFWDDEGDSRLDRPTLLLIVNWWLDHPFRTGQDVSQAFPYTIIGFSVSGDLLAD